MNDITVNNVPSLSVCVVINGMPPTVHAFSAVSIFFLCWGCHNSRSKSKGFQKMEIVTNVATHLGVLPNRTYKVFGLSKLKFWTENAGI